MPEQVELPIPAPEPRRVPVVLDAMLRLPAGLPDSVYAALSRAATFPNPEYEKRRKFGLYVGSTPRTLDLSRWVGDVFVAPRALTGALRSALAAEGLRADWRDERTVAPLEREFVFSAEWESRPYQERLVELLRVRENVLAHAPTASGKTCVVILALAVLRQRTMAVMGRRNLGNQYVEDCRRFLGFTPRLLGFGGKKTHPESSPLTVASQPALYRCAEEEAPYFGAVAFDEVQHASSRTHVETLAHLGARWRIGLSDDSTRHDKAQGMTYAHFGEVRDSVDVGTLVADGNLVPVILRVVQTGYCARDAEGRPIPRDALEPHERQARQVADEERNQLVARWVLDTCGEDNAGLVLSYRVEHCEWFHRALTRAGVECGLLLGGPAMKDTFDRAVARLRDGRLRCAAGTIGAVGEGFNVKRLDRGYLASAGSQNLQALKQMSGRFMRPLPGKGMPELYYFSDGLREPDPRLTKEENAAHMGWTGAQVRGLRRLVQNDPARFARAEILGRDGRWWPLLKKPDEE